VSFEGPSTRAIARVRRKTPQLARRYFLLNFHQPILPVLDCILGETRLGLPRIVRIRARAELTGTWAMVLFPYSRRGQCREFAAPTKVDEDTIQDRQNRLMEISRKYRRGKLRRFRARAR